MKKISFLIFFGILIVILSLLFSESKGSFSGVDSGISRVFQPIGIVFSDVSGDVKDLLVNLTNIGDLEKENKKLRLEVNGLQSKNAMMTADIQENESLKRALGFKDNSGFQTVAASITFFDPTNVRESIVIDKGAKDGIKPKMAATSEGFLIGRVTDVYANSAKILLITDPLSDVPAQIPDINADGLVQGQIGMGIIMNQIQQDAALQEGQNVITSGLGGGYPKGLLIGKIENITKQNNSIFQSASIRTQIDFNTLERVQIIIN